MQPKEKLSVSEIFVSIQGESSFAGELCFFIRLAGCNLRCRYCDTSYSWQHDNGNLMSIAELLKRTEHTGVPLVEITGGEPLLQAGTPLLCQELLDKGYKVLVETNGSLPVDLLPAGTVRIVDCKLPSSGEATRMDFANYPKLNLNDEIKFVIADKQDYLYAKEIIAEYHLADNVGHILMSTVFNEISPAELAEWIIKDKLPVRFQLQLHKFIWSPEERKR